MSWLIENGAPVFAHRGHSPQSLSRIRHVGLHLTPALPLCFAQLGDSNCGVNFQRSTLIVSITAMTAVSTNLAAIGTSVVATDDLGFPARARQRIFRYPRTSKTTTTRHSSSVSVGPQLLIDELPERGQVDLQLRTHWRRVMIIPLRLHFELAAAIDEEIELPLHRIDDPVFGDAKLSIQTKLVDAIAAGIVGRNTSTTRSGGSHDPIFQNAAPFLANIQYIRLRDRVIVEYNVGWGNIVAATGCAAISQIARRKVLRRLFDAERSGAGDATNLPRNSSTGSRSGSFQ